MVTPLAFLVLLTTSQHLLLPPRQVRGSFELVLQACPILHGGGQLIPPLRFLGLPGHLPGMLGLSMVTLQNGLDRDEVNLALWIQAIIAFLGL